MRYQAELSVVGERRVGVGVGLSEGVGELVHLQALLCKLMACALPSGSPGRLDLGPGRMSLHPHVINYQFALTNQLVLNHHPDPSIVPQQQVSTVPQQPSIKY